MESLRVGIVLNENFIPSTGGGFSYYDRLIEALDAHNFDKRINFLFVLIGKGRQLSFSKEVIFINPLLSFTLKERLLIGLKKLFAFSFITSPFLTRVLRRYETAYNTNVEKILLERNIQLLYYITPEANKFNFPYIATHWDSGHISMFAFPEVSMNNTFEKREQSFIDLKKAFAIFCESNAGKEELLSYLNINPDRVFIVPLFPGKVVALNINDDVEQSTLRSYDLETNNYFFYPAQFWPHKNHSTLLIAFKKATELYPKLKLLFTGGDKGNLNFIKTRIQELRLENSVVLPGFVSNEAIHCFYKNATALVMPTFLGPTNLPLIEAAELGCPVICSDLKGHREQLSDNAYFIKPDDSESIYTALLEVIKLSPERTPVKNQIFSLENSLKSIESNFLKLIPVRNTFGNNFKQF